MRWIERTLVHGEGDFEGEPFRLEGWQRRLIYRLYEYDPVTLRRIVRRMLLVLPKGCGKTELVAAICLAELAGPTRPTADGRGTLRRSPNIPVAAASFEQADRLYSAARAMATGGPLRSFVDAYETEIVLKGRSGRLFRVAAIAGTNDGGLPTCAGFDEIHEWSGRKERVHLVIGNSLAKRADGLELNLSTPDAADPDSLFGRLLDYGRKVAAGEIADPSFLLAWYTAGDHWRLDDPDGLRAAIREATPASWLDVERIAARLEVDRIAEHEFRRYHLAQLAAPVAGWLPPGAWAACADPTIPAPPAGTEITAMFDGSYNGDSTALVGCTIPTEPGELPHMWVLGCWERPRGAAEWLVPREEVKARVAEVFETYRVRAFGADPPGWHSELDAWEDTYGEAVIRFETNVRKRMSAACSRLYTAVVAELVTHDGDPRLARHLRSAVVKETPDGAYITKSGRHGPKIDLAVAAVGAYELAAGPAEAQLIPSASYA